MKEDKRGNSLFFITLFSSFPKTIFYSIYSATSSSSIGFCLPLFCLLYAAAAAGG
jgi:hypothetical protein